MTTMYDVTVASNAPNNGDAYAGYMDGKYQTYYALATMFPTKPVLSITVFGAAGARIADCEFGDLTPASAAYWANNEVKAGRRPTIYCSTSLYNQVAAELSKYGIAFGANVDWWEAHYDNIAVISSNPGAVAKQYASNNQYDTSVYLPSWVGQAAPPTPSFTTNYPGDKVQSIITQVGPVDNNGNGYFDESVIPDADKVINVEITGIPNPPDVGGYAPIPHHGVREQNGIARVVLEGAQPGGYYRCNVWVATS